MQESSCFHQDLGKSNWTNCQCLAKSSDTEVPGKREAKEQVKAITLRSGKVANSEKTQELTEEAEAEKEVKQ